MIGLTCERLKRRFYVEDKPILMNTYLILLVSVLALSSPNTAHEQGRDTTPTSQQAAYGLSYPLLGSQGGTIRLSPGIPQILREIARCESGNKQFDEKGNVLRGEIHAPDIGKYQINSAVWEREAKKLGANLLTEEGNEQFALELYRKYHTLPWESSRPCWEKAAEALTER